MKAVLWANVGCAASSATRKANVEEHNTRIPHSAFRGETPDVMYFGKDGEIQAQLAAAKQDARRRRLEANRAAHCAVCT